MNKLWFTTFLICLSSSLPTEVKGESITSFNQNLSKWFSAWELVYTNIYGLNNIKPVHFVLFDDRYVYSTSDVTIVNGESIVGKDLLNLSLKWKKKLHEGLLTLPDGSSVPVGMMCFAAENSISDTAFFVMPLTDFWAKQGVDSKTLKLEDLVTGVFLHEFSHTQQMDNFGKKISELILQYELGDEVNDDFIQDSFGKDSIFTESYNKEVIYFSKAIDSKNESFDQDLILGIQQMESRRKLFYWDYKTYLAEIEDIFLTMEGLGQYTMYLWLTHEKGANLDRTLAIEGVRRGKKIWSQDQGFLLFLVLEKYISPKQWAYKMFSSEMLFITDLLKEQLLLNTSVHD